MKTTTTRYHHSWLYPAASTFPDSPQSRYGKKVEAGYGFQRASEDQLKAPPPACLIASDALASLNPPSHNNFCTSSYQGRKILKARRRTGASGGSIFWECHSLVTPILCQAHRQPPLWRNQTRLLRFLEAALSESAFASSPRAFVRSTCSWPCGKIKPFCCICSRGECRHCSTFGSGEIESICCICWENRPERSDCKASS